jgi:hypothetical protein
VLGLALLAVNAVGLRTAGSATDQPANLSADGEEAIRFIGSREESAAATWLYGQVRGSDDLVYTDLYGQLRWLGTTGDVAGLQLDITPRTLDRDAWVFADRANVVIGQARGRLQGHQSLYEFPAEYLDQYYDAVYANGASTVYHGTTP